MNIYLAVLICLTIGLQGCLEGMIKGAADDLSKDLMSDLEDTLGDATGELEDKLDDMGEELKESLDSNTLSDLVEEKFAEVSEQLSSSETETAALIASLRASLAAMADLINSIASTSNTDLANQLAEIQSMLDEFDGEDLDAVSTLLEKFNQLESALAAIENEIPIETLTDAVGEINDMINNYDVGALVSNIQGYVSSITDFIGDVSSAEFISQIQSFYTMAENITDLAMSLYLDDELAKLVDRIQTMTPEEAENYVNLKINEFIDNIKQEAIKALQTELADFKALLPSINELLGDYDAIKSQVLNYSQQLENAINDLATEGNIQRAKDAIDYLQDIVNVYVTDEAIKAQVLSILSAIEEDVNDFNAASNVETPTIAEEAITEDTDPSEEEAAIDEEKDAYESYEEDTYEAYEEDSEDEDLVEDEKEEEEEEEEDQSGPTRPITTPFNRPVQQPSRPTSRPTK